MEIKSLAANIWRKFVVLSDMKKAVVVCLIGVGVIVLRRPELLFNAQFWAEDFAVFYRDAYMRGGYSIFKTYSGILPFFPRLVALPLLLVPLRFAPAAANLVAILVMVLPLFIFWSDSTLIKKFSVRSKMTFTFLYLLIPGIAEIYGNFTNTIWFLAAAAILVLVRGPKTQKKWLVFDITVLIVSGLSGPFAPFLALTAAYLITAQKSKNRMHWIKAAAIVACALIQIAVYVQAPQQRTASLVSQKRELINNYSKPIKITGMRFFALPVAGEKIITKEIAGSPQMFMLGMFAIIMTIYAFIKANIYMRAVILFGSLIYASTFVRAQTVPIVQFWDMLQLNSFGARYFFIPIFCWLLILVYFAALTRNNMGKIASALVALYVLFFPFYFRVKELKKFNFRGQANEFSTLRPGQQYCFDINPDEAWKTCLKKN